MNAKNANLILIRVHSRNSRRLCLARDLDLNRIRFRNPFIGLLRYSVGTALLVIGAHDRRHLWQANQVRAAAES